MAMPAGLSVLGTEPTAPRHSVQSGGEMHEEGPKKPAGMWATVRRPDWPKGVRTTTKLWTGCGRWPG
ncbi:hypothetical protein CGRA01v4_12130 [Colletotrichum graminicola]|nr:hypothetical protein CGRA01v4_12130 [Colletotrichum graminicola]